MKGIIVAFLVCCSLVSWAQDEKQIVSGILDGVYMVEQPYAEWQEFDSLIRVGQPNKARSVLESILEKSILHEAKYNTIRALLSFEGLVRYVDHDEKLLLFHNLYRTTDVMQPHTGDLARIILLQELIDNHWTWVRHNATDTSFVYKNQTYNLKQQAHRTAFVYNELEAIRANLEQLYTYPFEPFFELLYGKKEKLVNGFTVMDFVGHQLIGMYSSAQILSHVSSIEDEHKIDYRTTLLLNPKEFAKVKIDVQSAFSHAVSIYQLLEKKHQNNPELLSEVYYERLRFALDHNKVDDAKALWKTASEFIGNNQYRSRFMYEYCRLLYEEGIQFDFQTNKDVENYLKEAHTLLENELKRFPESISVTVMTSLKKLIEAQQVSMQMQNYAYPKEDIPLKITHRNIENITIHVFTKPEVKSKNMTIRDYLHTDVAKEVSKQSIKVVDKKDFNARTTELLLDGMKATGDYFVLVTPSHIVIDDYLASDSLWNTMPRTIYGFTVTEIFVATRSTLEGFEVVVTDYKTGKPLKNARVSIYPKRNRYVFDKMPARIGTTNKDGLYKTGIEHWFDYEVSYKGSKLKSSDNHYNPQKPRKTGRIHVLTDRGIYRPGQTVYVKAVAYEGKNNEFKVVPNTNLILTVKNASWQEVYKTTLKTNDFGAIDGSFVLPQSGPLGNFRIEVAYEKDKENYFSNTKNIRVEEYKRPTFEVTVNQPETIAQLNDTVYFSGEAKAFAGYPISGAKVEIKVYRKWSTHWRFGGGDNRDLMVSFDTLTDQQGKFTASFFAPEATLAPSHAYYTFEVEVKITDISGETHDKQLAIPLNKSGLALVYNGVKAFNTLTEHIATYQILNLFGKEQPPQKVVVNVYQHAFQAQFEERIWSKGEFLLYDEKAWRNLFPYEKTEAKNYKQVHLKTVEINSGDTLKLNELVGNKQGNYTLEAVVVSDKGDTLTASTALEVIEIHQKRIPQPVPLWTHLSHSSATVGQAVEFQVGSVFNKGRVLVRLENGNGVIEEKWLDTKQRQKWCYIIQEEDRGNIAFSALIIQDGKRYYESKTVSVPYDNKQLEIKKSVFRDELLPGSEEKWTFTISGKEAEKIGADLCMGMYDASLDQFVNHSWGFWPYRSSHLYARWSGPSQRYASVQNGIGGWRDNASIWNRDDRKYRGSRYHNFIRSNHLTFGNQMYRNYNEYAYDDVKELSEVQVVSYRQPLIYKDGGASGETITREDIAKMPIRDARAIASTVGGVEEIPQESSAPDIQIRENFNETAFFYPSLEINEAGEYEVAFTLPESLTQWKVFGLAHTKDVQIGSLQLDAYAKKDVMVTANAPRFFRQGDTFNFSAKVVNLTDEDQDITVELTFLNPLTNEPVLVTGDQAVRKNTVVTANASTEVAWELNLAIETGVIAYKIVAFNEKYSDGEQKPIPVLTNRQLVTEAMPFILTKEGTTKMTFDALKNNRSTTLKHESLTFEFTGNIAWNAVLALPYLAEYPYECSEQLFARYFANALATNLLASKPKIKAVFDTWQMESKDVLTSQLEKNSELKSILLEETPWVVQVKTESERNARLAQLFELNQLANAQRSTLNKLKKQQNRDGSFGWFGGNRANIYITQHLVAGFGQLQALGVTLPKEAKEISDKALTFLNAHYVSEYKKQKERADKPMIVIGNLELMWLYVSAYFPLADKQEVLKVRNVYDSLLVEDWKRFGLQQQAMAGMYFLKSGNEKMANIIAHSLRDRAKQSPQQGMYFPENSGGRHWNQRKIETHALITAFLAEMGTEQAEIDALRLWLFLHKQRNAWESTKTTTTAVYALLAYGTDYLENDNLPSITVGNELLVYTSTENKNERHVTPVQGLGHIKTSWQGSEVSSEQATVSITKTDASPSLGALYWQYFEDMDKVVPSSSTAIKVVKTYHRVEAGVKGDELVSDSLFKRGDRVRVTLTVTTQQELEFVHLKDLRPAGFEPRESLSKHHWEQGLWYYQSPRDVSMNYFIDYLPKGTYTFTYDLFVNSSGTFNSGSASIQCMYAPEFIGNSGGIKVYGR